jgi:hypothetical protein
MPVQICGQRLTGKVFPNWDKTDSKFVNGVALYNSKGLPTNRTPARRKGIAELINQIILPIFYFMFLSTLTNILSISRSYSENLNSYNISNGYGDIIHTKNNGFYIIDSLYPDFRYSHVTEINGSKISYSRERFAHTKDGKLYFISRKVYVKKGNWIYNAFDHSVEYLELEARLIKEEVVSYFSNGLVSGYHTKSGDINFIGYRINSIESPIWRLSIQSVQMDLGAINDQISIIINPFEEPYVESDDVMDVTHYAVISTQNRALLLIFSEKSINSREVNLENAKTVDYNNLNNYRNYELLERSIFLFLSQAMCTYSIDILENIEKIHINLHNYLSLERKTIQIMHSSYSPVYYALSSNILRRKRRDLEIFPCASDLFAAHKLYRLEYFRIDLSFSVRRLCRKSLKGASIQIARRFEDIIGDSGSPAGILLTCLEDENLHLFDVWNSWGSSHTIENDDGPFSKTLKDVIAPCYSNEICPSSESGRIKVKYIGSIFVGG